MCIPFLKTVAILFLRTNPKELIRDVYEVLDLSTTMSILLFFTRENYISKYSTRDLSKNYG